MNAKLFAVHCSLLTLSFCALCALCGCMSKPPSQQPLVIGQRVLTPDPGAVLTVPALTPPAAQWYLIDDVGLGEWLGISPPGATK